MRDYLTVLGLGQAIAAVRRVSDAHFDRPGHGHAPVRTSQPSLKRGGMLAFTSTIEVCKQEHVVRGA